MLGHDGFLDLCVRYIVGPPIQPWPQWLLVAMLLVCHVKSWLLSAVAGPVRPPHTEQMSRVGLDSYPGISLSPWTLSLPGA